MERRRREAGKVKEKKVKQVFTLSCLNGKEDRSEVGK